MIKALAMIKPNNHLLPNRYASSISLQSALADCKKETSGFSQMIKALAMIKPNNHLSPNRYASSISLQSALADCKKRNQWL